MNKRILYLVLATCAMLMSGLMYNFTVFTQSIAVEFNTSSSVVSLIFSLSQIHFFLGGFTLGLVFHKIRFSILSLSASFVMFLGLFLSGCVSRVGFLFLTYSIMMNLAAGFIYKAVLSATLPWFSEKPGFATGIMMMGAGLTAFVFNVPVSWLIEVKGWRYAMKTLAFISLVVTGLAGVLIREKRRDYVVVGRVKTEDDERQYTTREMLKTREFYYFFIWSVLLLAGCTSITGNAVGLSTSIGMSATRAALVSTAISLANASSRIFYGSIYDRYGRKTAMGISTLFFVIGAFGLYAALSSSSLLFLLLSFVAIGISFGGVPTIASTFVLKVFGKQHYPENFGVQGSYSLFSPIFGTTTYSFLYGLTGDMQRSYLQVIAYALIAVMMYALLNRLLKDKETI